MIRPDVCHLHIISGGQTGADRAALQWAIDQHIPHSGWCPSGRKAEDGEIPPAFQLQETPSSSYEQRTEWNVRDSDGTAILSISRPLSGGSAFTHSCCESLGKPFIIIFQQGTVVSHSRLLLSFVQRHNIQKLNIAGPRASLQPKIGEFVYSTLTNAFIKPAPESRKR